MKKCLVTGGCGFVGRHLVARLLALGHAVDCVDCLAPGGGGLPPDRWPFADPRQFQTFRHLPLDCREFFARQPDAGYDLVFHLAAMVGGRLTIENQPLAVAEDLAIDAAYWSWAAKARPGKTVYFSSSAAYPIGLQRPEHHVLLKEDLIRFDGDIGMPDMTYGWAKLTGEYLAQLAHAKHGLKSVVFRPFSGYGADQDDSYPFPSICKRVLAGRGGPTLSVWGSGRQMRDFIHIEDCITGILLMMDKIDNAEAVNLSTGIYTSFIDFARLAAELCGWRPEIRGTSDRPEGVFARGGDTTRQLALGFRPATDLRTGLRQALAWYEGGMQRC